MTVSIGATLLPFWTPGLTILLAVAAALATLRSPRLGLAIALFVPVFPLGNVAQAAAVVYAALAVGWLALCWRDARAGLLFMAGPVLAAIGAIALLPLAVQPARGRARRALQAFAGVFAAVAVAGLRGNPLPLTGVAVPSLGVDGSTSVSTVIRPGRRTPAGESLVRRARGRARRFGGAPARRAQARVPGHRPPRACQIGLILLLAPTLPALPSCSGHSSSARSSRPSRSRPAATLSREAATPGMSVLRTIESKIEGLFEGVFGRAFRTHVQPVELARKLAKEMDEHRSVSVSRVYVPNEYTIYLSSADRQQFISYEGSLVGELQEYLTEHARREAYALLTPPRVKFATDDDLAVGEFGIATRVAQPDEGFPSLPAAKPPPLAPVQSVSIPVPAPTVPVEAPAAVATTMVYRQAEPETAAPSTSTGSGAAS